MGDLEAPLHQALDVLADAGLGGLRSTGHGAFCWGWQEKDLPRAEQVGYAVTLARYAPRDVDEITHTLRVERSAYKLVTVGGWCVDDYGHPWQRQRVRLVAEGSIIGHHSQPEGWLVPVTPHKPKDWQGDASPWPFGENGCGRQVYRWGFAFPFPVAEAALPPEVNHA
jgi:CRISPR type III-A-associated RAMP protein Csm4